MPRASDLTFCTAIHKQHEKHPHFATLSRSHMRGIKLRDEESFVVRHFAADVCYTMDGFLEKNADLLPPQVTLRTLSALRCT